MHQTLLYKLWDEKWMCVMRLISRCRDIGRFRLRRQNVSIMQQPQIQNGDLGRNEERGVGIDIRLRKLYR